MDYPNEKSRVFKKNFDKAKRVSLKDVPLEDRRKAAKKPLFLTRYE
jgi:hypothetical protein